MPEKILTSLFVKNAPAGKHNDGGGLWLYVRKPGSARWVLRYTLHGARHEMGLGPADSVSLAEATDASHEVAEACLGHATGNAVSRAYQRSDFLEARAALMARWGDHVTGGSGAVVQLAARR